MRSSIIILQSHRDKLALKCMTPEDDTEEYKKDMETIDELNQDINLLQVLENKTSYREAMLSGEMVGVVTMKEGPEGFDDLSEGDVMAIKCPECLDIKVVEELNMFGGLCEECSGAFD